MNVLVTGVNGFVGRHLVRALKLGGYRVIGCDIDQMPAFDDVDEYHCIDIADSDLLTKSFRDDPPEFCIHLASQTFVPASWSDPLTTISTNVGGTLNILELYRGTGVDMKLLVVSSVEIYGTSPPNTQIDENSPHRPESPYALTKSFADNLAILYARRYGMHVMTARPSNHIGPGQSANFVVPSFARQCAHIKHCLTEPTLQVGNLDAERDFTDVRDVVRAYVKLIGGGRQGQPYNIASGKMVSIRSILDHLCQVAKIEPQIVMDPDRYREEQPKATIDTTRIHDETGWSPSIPLKQTLQDIYDSCERELPGNCQHQSQVK